MIINSDVCHIYLYEELDEWMRETESSPWTEIEARTPHRAFLLFVIAICKLCKRNVLLINQNITMILHLGFKLKLKLTLSFLQLHTL